MIILDECLDDECLLQILSDWWRGAVKSTKDCQIPKNTPDEIIFRMLRDFKDCIFITKNWKDFWEFDGDPRFCVLCLDLGNTDPETIVRVIKAVLTADTFRTAPKRNGLVIRANQHKARYYRRKSQGEIGEPINLTLPKR